MNIQELNEFNRLSEGFEQLESEHYSIIQQNAWLVQVSEDGINWTSNAFLIKDFSFDNPSDPWFTVIGTNGKFNFCRLHISQPHFNLGKYPEELEETNYTVITLEDSTQKIISNEKAKTNDWSFKNMNNILFWQLI